ncbi:hypothetical protein NLM31_12870 [Bradyrhizobium sp. CCGUVB4N]|uniref:beta strand repeat-containing protein n=1 Tax=Bradyrhizobium sp. CCGUVB4N TaxID=2949631 RepID=UPI0020B209EA|nr:hypothetical protein [Bradyrhizobium sp. CCGUVB4N]MCP3381233.1 hypothetical protein [Bradyrhizobium sp. CCGUVB4N]
MAQYASRPGYSVGTAGAACDGTNMQYGWPDANGNILKCVSNVWQTQGISATAGGSNTQVQYNSGGALAGDSGLTYVNPNLTIGYGSLYIGTSSATAGAVKIGGQNAISFPSSDSTAGASLAIGSSALASQTTSAAYSNIAIGYQSLGLSTMTTAAVHNVAIGNQTLSHLTSGNQMVAIGYDTLWANTTGVNNVAVGWNALLNNTTGSYNDAFGHDALNGNVTGSGNTALGEGAMFGNFVTYSSSNNTAVGFSSMLDISSGGSNTAIGQASCVVLTTGGNNVCIGQNAASALLTGNYNTLMGQNVGPTLASGSQNTLLGTNADVTGSSSTLVVAIGYGTKGNSTDVVIGGNAMSAGGTGFSDTVLGFAAGTNVTGSNDTIIGNQVASTTLVGGSGNILIGTSSNVDTPAAGTNNFLNIGNLIYGTSIGSATSPGNVGIGTTNPMSMLHLNNGEVQIGSSSASCTGNTAGALRYSAGTAYYCNSANWTAIGTAGAGGGGSGTVTSSTAGQVAYFQNTGSTVIGTSTLNIAGGYVGVGTTAPVAGEELTIGSAASTPGLKLSGNWYKSGTATTTKPQLLIEPNGATSTAWSTAGTGLGVNAGSGFTGNLLDLQTNGTEEFYVDKNGNATASQTVSANAFSAASTTSTNFNSSGSSAMTVASVLRANDSNTGTLSSFSGAYLNIAPARTQTGAAGVTDSGNFLYLARANTVNNASGTYTISGDLAKLSSNCTQTAGTCTDTSSILSLTQSYASASGTVLKITNSGTGYAATFIGGNVGIGTTAPVAGEEVTIGSAASTPGMKLSGYWYTSGTGTTSKPQLLIEPNGTTSTAWAVTGTGLGINAGSGFSGRLIDAQLNGVSSFSVSSGGTTTIAGTIYANASLGNTALSLNQASGFTTGSGVQANSSSSGTLTGFTGKYIDIEPTRTQTGAAGVTDSGNFLYLARANTVNNASGTYTISGDLAKLSSNCTQTAGTCTDTSSILSLTQSYASASGTVLKVTNGGTGYAATFSGGNVGIGTTTPMSLLHVYNGEVQIGSSSATCTAGVNDGALRYSSGTVYYCSSSAWTAIGTAGASGLPSGGTQYQMVREGASAAQWENVPYDLPIFMPGTQTASAIARIILPRAIQLPASLTSSQCLAKTAATASTTVTLNKISSGVTTGIGTAVWAASGTSCTFTFSSNVSLAAGDMVEFAFPASPDATLSDIAITLAGIRQ